MSSSRARELIVTAHDRGMLAMVEHALTGYVRAAGETRTFSPVRQKMLEDALALVSAVLDETAAEHDAMIEEEGI